ncbi:hypothetical protein [Ureibacillus chungkukjangi]|uniref:Uncharacterized protein n=1 Tax=Ureibacillus chungkukjangi TaxID=1202712 RepID=A0A318TMT2_9BACL|nr:hypothetical protein [Ureibacillus chungkukjangi]MCM3388161.1 hypothetical protein [Ureibacillus chungkukjangi]MDI7743994.1 hypothetical protein [Lysinibacillus fusiformis]PYF06181.1 hypothetical protein BJ095_11110 [Ureibacillus chungkukjangi]
MIVIDKLDGIDESIIEQMKEGLEKLIIESFAKVLNLSRLDYLYFPNDFDKAVIDFQVEQNMAERGSTNNEMGTAFGKTMEVDVNGQLKDRVFLRKEILLHLFFGEDNTKSISLNTIHHELCHVQEHYDLANMVEFQEELDVESPTLDSVLNAHAMNIFSEYIVPKMAVSTKGIDNIIKPEFIEDILNYTQEEIDRVIESHENEELIIYKLFGEVQLKTSHLLKVLSTTLGELDGIEIETALIIEKQLDSLISNYNLNHCWLSLKSALRGLNETYPNWKKVEEIEPLKDCILETWNVYGIYPEKRGIKIHKNS